MKYLIKSAKELEWLYKHNVNMYAWKFHEESDYALIPRYYDWSRIRKWLDNWKPYIYESHLDLYAFDMSYHLIMELEKDDVQG